MTVQASRAAISRHAASRALAPMLTAAICASGCATPPTQMVINMETDAPMSRRGLSVTIRAGTAPPLTLRWRAGTWGYDQACRDRSVGQPCIPPLRWDASTPVDAPTSPPDAGGMDALDATTGLDGGARPDGSDDVPTAPSGDGSAGPADALRSSFVFELGSFGIPRADYPFERDLEIQFDVVIEPSRPEELPIVWSQYLVARFLAGVTQRYPIFLSADCARETVGCSPSIPAVRCTQDRWCRDRRLTCGRGGECFTAQVTPPSGDAGRDGTMDGSLPTDSGSTTTPPARCGDGRCQTRETCSSCPDDCGCCASDIVCAGACVDPSSNPSNCGGCGIRCAAGEQCSGARCVPATSGTCGTCAMGTTCYLGMCRTTCAGTRSSCGPPGFCTACSPDEACTGQACSGPSSCLGTNASCGPAGACVACASGTTCLLNACRMNCAGTRSSCGSPGFCTACPPDETCTAQNCVSPSSCAGTNANCGLPGACAPCAAGSSCVSNSCRANCAGTRSSCGSPGFCTACAPDEMCSAQNCVSIPNCAGTNASCGLPGACGPCAAGSTCVSNSCRANCSGTRGSCGSPGFCVACAPDEMCTSQRCVTIPNCAGTNASCGNPGVCRACAAGTTCVGTSCLTNCLGTRSSCGRAGSCTACSPIETCIAQSCT